MTEQISGIAKQWAEAIRSRNTENVVSLYHPDSSLWGTLAKEVRHGHQAINGYFESFLQKDDLKCEFKDGYIRIHDQFAFYSGSYLFTWNTDGRPVELPARFSFVYKKENDRWMILEHHSSLFPENPFPIEKYITTP